LGVGGGCAVAAAAESMTLLAASGVGADALGRSGAGAAVAPSGPSGGAAAVNSVARLFSRGCRGYHGEGGSGGGIRSVGFAWILGRRRGSGARA